jgi:hypothetical protein
VDKRLSYYLAARKTEPAQASLPHGSTPCEISYITPANDNSLGSVRPAARLWPLLYRLVAVHCRSVFAITFPQRQ